MDEIKVGEIFTITDENEDDQLVEVLAKVTIDEKEYIAISFVEDLEEESEDDIDIFFLRVHEDGDLDPIETDEEFEKVSSAFDEILNEEKH